MRFVAGVRCGRVPNAQQRRDRVGAVVGRAGTRAIVVPVVSFESFGSRPRVESPTPQSSFVVNAQRLRSAITWPNLSGVPATRVGRFEDLCSGDRLIIHSVTGCTVSKLRHRRTSVEIGRDERFFTMTTETVVAIERPL